MKEEKENEETCEATLGPSDAEIIEQPKSSSMEVEGENKMKEDRKGEEKETEKPEAKNGEEQVAATDTIEEKDVEDVIKDDHDKSIAEKLDGDKPDGCSPLEQSAVTNEGIHEETSCDKPSNSEVSKIELQEEVPVNGNDKSNVETTTQEEANKVKPTDENDVNSRPEDPVPDPSVDNGMDVDKNILMIAGGDSFEKGSNGVHDDSLDSQKIVDNGSGSQKSAGADACNARPSVLNLKSVKEEVPMATDSAEPNHSLMFDMETSEGGESGTEEEQSAFVKELENFFKEKSLEFKPPKFYGEPVNLLKLWRAVIQLGGYDKVTTSKLWRQVGESFRPPKTCTTVSWTFRIFYEKALLDYEKHRFHGGELILHAAQPDPLCIASPAGNTQTPGSGRQRRDAAARAMQGWHSHRLLSNGEVSDPIIKDKSSIPSKNREKQLKSIGVQKRKRPLVGETTDKAAVHPKVIKTQSDNNVTIIDMGPPADWVKINVKTTKDCYEVYALVPGLLREEVRVQTDPAGRLVITGEPEHVDNPWGVTPFKKIVSLPSRIDPHQTSAVVTLHGQLFVRVPFEQSD